MKRSPKTASLLASLHIYQRTLRQRSTSSSDKPHLPHPNKSWMTFDWTKRRRLSWSRSQTHRLERLSILNAEVIVTVGVVEMGDLDDKRSTGAPTARWTITPPKHAASRSVPRSGGDNPGGNEECACYHCGIPGYFRADCIYYKRAKEASNRVRQGTALMATAGDRDLI